MKNFIKKAKERVWLEGDPDKDRSVGLVVCGILEIVLGILCFSVAMLLLVMVSSTGLGGMKAAHFWMAMGIMFYLTAWFIIMGLGSLKRCRWARSLTLVGAWVTIFFGTLVLALALYILPELHNLLMESELISPMGALVFLYIAILVLLVLQVIFPLVAIVFYSMAGVQTTCERKHPSPGWTDRCPLPLLAMGSISILGSLSVFVGGTTNFVVFFFGTILKGGTGFAVLLLISISFAYVGWGAYKRKTHAWWGAYALVLLTSSSMMLTFSEMDMDMLYLHMDYTEEQMTHLAGLGPFNPAVLTFVSGIWGIMACVFLVWVRDCFRPEKDQVLAKSYEQIKAEEETNKPAESGKPRMRVGD